MVIEQKHIDLFNSWRADWNKFVRDVLHARLDREQQAIITSIQTNPMTAVASGTARGKDFVAACGSLCFMYLTPTFDERGRLVGNTKVAMTAPTARQVGNIMSPEVRRLFKAAQFLPGRLVAFDIRTDYEEWFLTGFKAGDDATEAWSGFHAVNTMFVVTEASGISEATFAAIEGNLQGNSRLLIVFQPECYHRICGPRYEVRTIRQIPAQFAERRKRSEKTSHHTRPSGLRVGERQSEKLGISRK